MNFDPAETESMMPTMVLSVAAWVVFEVIRAEEDAHRSTTSPSPALTVSIHAADLPCRPVSRRDSSPPRSAIHRRFLPSWSNNLSDNFSYLHILFPDLPKNSTNVSTLTFAALASSVSRCICIFQLSFVRMRTFSNTVGFSPPIRTMQ